MNKEEMRKYLEILELEPGASLEDIKSAYKHLKTLYASDSPLFTSISDSFDPEERREILNNINEAFMKLKQHYERKEKEKKDTTQTRVRNLNIPEFERYSGNALRLTREVLGIGLEEIAFNTGIPLNHLECIEEERYDALPPKVYIRAMIKKYAESLFLNSAKVVDDYIARMEKKQAQSSSSGGKDRY